MRIAHVLHSLAPGSPMAVPRTAYAVAPSSRSTVLKILGGAGLAALSFWVTLHAIEYFQARWEPIRSKILTFGGASSSAPSLTQDTKFQFVGNGYAEIQDTNALQCLKSKCRFSLKVAFSATTANPQLIIGQSFSGENGWHLLYDAGRLRLTTEGGGGELAITFSPQPEHPYKVDFGLNDEGVVDFSLDDVPVMKTYAMPFTDIARPLTVGGRAGSATLAFSGKVTDLHVSRRK